MWPRSAGRTSTRSPTSGSSRSPLESAPRALAVIDAMTVEDFRGLEVLPEKGSLIGRDDGNEVRTPYDNCVLIMPSRRLVKGQTAVRLGRFVD